MEEHVQKAGVAIETQGFTFVTSGKKRETLTVSRFKTSDRLYSAVKSHRQFNTDYYKSTAVQYYKFHAVAVVKY